jgi:hypothetical protein
MMKEKLWVTGALVIVFLVGVGAILATMKPEASPSEAGTPEGRIAAYTLSEVGKHSTEDDCWTAIGSNTYNLTEWISQHPGGDRAILSICGIDGTAAFQGQHGGQGAPEAMLATFKNGILITE